MTEDFDRLKAMKDRIEREQAARAWQSIGTAPTDGSRFLGGWLHKIYGWCWSSCRWQADGKHPKGGYFYAEGGGCPTHWLSLPPAPSAGEPVSRSAVDPSVTSTGKASTRDAV